MNHSTPTPCQAPRPHGPHSRHPGGNSPPPPPLLLLIFLPPLRYLALEALARLALMPDILMAVRHHLPTVTAALRDPDLSIRKKAMDLLFTMCDTANASELVGELLAYLVRGGGRLEGGLGERVWRQGGNGQGGNGLGCGCQGRQPLPPSPHRLSPPCRLPLTSQCGRSSSSRSPSSPRSSHPTCSGEGEWGSGEGGRRRGQWWWCCGLWNRRSPSAMTSGSPCTPSPPPPIRYVDTALQLLERAGDYVSDDIWHRVVQLVTNNESMQQYAARNMVDVLRRGANHEVGGERGGR